MYEVRELQIIMFPISNMFNLLTESISWLKQESYLLQVKMEIMLKKHLYKNLTPKNLSSKISYDQTAATQGKFIQYSLFKIELMSPTHLLKLY